MVEVKNLPQSVLMLVFIGILVGAGVLVLGSFSDASRNTRSVADNEVLCNFGVPCTMAYYPVTSASGFSVRNSSGATVPSTAYQLTLATGVFNLTSRGYNQTAALNFTYSFYETSPGSTALTNVVTAVSNIPATWLPLIITVFALAIILRLVIKNFYMVKLR